MDDISSFSVTFLTGNENGLADVYLGKKQNQWEYFEPTTVGGYPAVYAGSPDLRDLGECDLGVGISDKLHFTVIIQGHGNKEGSCGAAREVASAALTTMKGGA